MTDVPVWLGDVLGAEISPNEEGFSANGVRLRLEGAILRTDGVVSPAQDQTRATFGLKWQRRDTYEGSLLVAMRAWLFERYGNVAEAAWLSEHGDNPILLDAGCGAGLSALELWAPVLPRLRYIGADVSEAVDVARTRFRERGFQGAFIQADFQRLPVPQNSVDLVFAEGVLHHCDDTRAALEAVVSYLKPGGRILFYVYKKKGPVREFTDDYIRHQLKDLSPREAWDAVIPLTRLGKALGELNVEIDVPEDIELLDIPAGRINLQRLFYWHIFKACYRPEMSLDEMTHVNFDWYVPRNAHRQTPEEVRVWCDELSLIIEHERVEDAGITIIAKKAA